jgi:hypothetical protein
MGNRGRAHGGAIIAVAAAILVALILPGVAQADTIGSPLFGDSAPVGCAENNTCILTQGRLDGDVFNNVVSEDGTITGFTFRHVTGDVKFVVLREEGASDYAVVGSTDAITGSGDDEDEAYTLTPGIPVRQGDFIGLALDENATVGARDATGEDTNLLELTDSETPVLAADDRSVELFLRATWEPTETDPGPGPGTDPIFEDDDGGSFSTAVPDPLAALKAGARPKVKISAKAMRASKKYSVAITVRNPNGYRVKGKLSLKAKGLKLGSKAFSIGAESSKSVRVKLSGKARRRLGRRRKMKVTASASFKGPIGKAGSAKQSITIKAPKRPKPKKRTPSGGGGGGGLFPTPFCVPHIEYDANGWAHAVPC